MTNTKPVVFKNKNGHQLFGVLHEPVGANRKSTAIVLFSPGIKMRVAPHGMYKKMADKYSMLGFTVLRFDFYGLGDAEGEIETRQLSSIYNSIQSGRYIDDALISLDWLQSQTGISQFIVGGLCGGAITGMLAAEYDKRVMGLLALGIPVTLDVGEEKRHKHISQGQLLQLRKGYLRNFFKIDSWLRLITLKSDFKVIFKSLMQSVGGKNKVVASISKESSEKTTEQDNTNPKFAKAFFSMLKTGRVMCHIFSGSDRLAWEFNEKFAVPYKSELIAYQALYEIHTIEKANHILAYPDWFNEMLLITIKWLNKFE